MLFNTRCFFIGFSLLLTMVLAGCEEAPDDKRNTNPKFYLLSPIVGNEVLDTDENLRIKYSGDVNEETISIVLNGVDVTELMDPSDITGTAKTSLLNVRNALVLGTNTLVISTDVPNSNPTKPPKHFSQTFTFFFDDKKPHIEITCVKVVDENFNDADIDSVACGNAQPYVGATLFVEGNIIDISDIISLQFNYIGDIAQVRETGNANPGINQYTNTINDEGYRTFMAKIPNYPDVTIPTGNPHFSYSVVDVHNQLFTEQFMGTGTMLSNKMALQINEGFLNNINPLVNGMIDHALELPLLAGGLENLVVQGVRSAVPLTISESTLNSIQSKPIGADYSTDRVLAVSPYGGSFCDPFLVNLDPTPNTLVGNFCAAYLREIVISGLSFDTHFSKGANGELLLNLTLDVAELSALAELAGIERLCQVWFGSVCTSDAYVYKGGITSRIQMRNFQMKTTLRVSTSPDLRFTMSRISPISIDLGLFGQVEWVDGACVNGNVCRRSSDLAWAAVFYRLGMDVFNFQAMIDGNSDIPNSNGTPDKKEIVPLMEDILNAYAAPLIDGLFTDDVTPARDGDADDLYLLSEVTKEMDNGAITDNTQATSMSVAISQNAMTISEGNFVADPFRYATSYEPVNGGLGSLFQSQGCYVLQLIGTACGSAFKEQVNHFNEMDMVFALPANSINQYLLSTFQTGNLDDLDFNVSGAVLMHVLPDDIAETDNMNINLSYTQPPLLKFSPDRNGGINPAFTIGGQRFEIGDPGALGSVKVTATNVDVEVVNTTRPGVPLIEANVDIDFEVYVTTFNTSGDPESQDQSKIPALGLKENSLIVRVNKMQEQFEDTPGLVSDGIAAGIQAYLSDDDFQEDFSDAFTTSIMYMLGGEDFKSQKDLIIDVSDTYDPVQLPIPQEILDIEPLLASISEQGMSVLLGDSLPRSYGVIVRQFKIEQQGSYLSVGLDIRNSATGWTSEQETQHFFEFQLVP